MAFSAKRTRASVAGARSRSSSASSSLESPCCCSSSAERCSCRSERYWSYSRSCVPTARLWLPPANDPGLPSPSAAAERERLRAPPGEALASEPRGLDLLAADRLNCEPASWLERWRESGPPSSASSSCVGRMEAMVRTGAPSMEAERERERRARAELLPPPRPARVLGSIGSWKAVLRMLDSVLFSSSAPGLSGSRARENHFMCVWEATTREEKAQKAADRRCRAVSSPPVSWLPWNATQALRKAAA
mmetsp:Transcript_16471/g.45937  ORF Transcript_16471/g.45937 Transcript_16471/m.45937 type:complete len:248 (+) Transcript_16471:6635-7378(+)